MSAAAYVTGQPPDCGAGDMETDDEAGGFVQLPFDEPPSASTGYQLAHLRVTAPGDLGSPASGETGRESILAAFAVLLHRYAQQEVIAFDVSLRGGARQVTAQLQSRGAGAEPVSVKVRELARKLAAAELAAEPGPPQAGATERPAKPPLANTALTFLVAIAPPPELGLDAEGSGSGGDHLTAAYDLHVVVGGQDQDSSTELVASYNARVFRPETIERLLASLTTLIAAVRQAPDTPMRSLPLLGPADRRALELAGASGHAQYPAIPVHRIFESWAHTQPDALAAESGGHQLAYGELEARSNRLAHHLIASGVTKGTAVAVCVPPSVDVVVALLAVFKAGAIYVPLDPTHPDSLLRAVIDEARPCLLLTHTSLAGLGSLKAIRQVCLDVDLPAMNGLPATPPELEVTLADLAYLLYTSGTTGQAKGVLATHGNLAHYLHVAQQAYGFRREDVFCSLARYTFSISMFELLSPLCAGASLRLLARDDVLSPRRLALELADVTVVHAGPSLLANLFRYLARDPAAPRAFPRMRHASSGGDLVPPAVLEQMKTVFENAELFVIYGCTEVSCMGTTHPVDRAQPVRRTLVGKAFPDVTVRVLDGALQPVPLGVVGEICFAGPGVVPRYFDRPALDAEKFVIVDGKRFYRTGDLGRLHASGGLKANPAVNLEVNLDVNLEILGRRDFQVQVRGIRIELGGIENAVRALGLASQCVVLVEKLADQDARLVAFVVEPSPAHATLVTFRQALGRALPDYMLPQSLVVLEALPLTANGKVDRRRLHELAGQAPTEPAPPAATAGPAVAANPVEAEIAAAFAACLGVEEVGLDDHFFDLGGHSLLAVALLEMLEDKLGVRLPAQVLFEHGSVRALAAQAQGAFVEDPRPIALNRNLSGPTVFVLLGVHLYRELARHLEGRYSVQAVYAGRELLMFDSPGSAPSVEALAADYFGIIRRFQPTGPYRLVGMSFGGIVAYEVARQLRAAGQSVTFLGLLDTVLPERGLRARLAQLRRLQALPGAELARLVATRLRRWTGARRGGSSGSGVGVGVKPVSRSARASRHGEVEAYSGEARLLPLEDQRQEAYRIATETYVDRLEDFSGNVTLIVAARRMREVLLQSPSLGWGEVIPTLNVRNVESDHLGLLEEPHVAEVAAIFRAALD